MLLIGVWMADAEGYIHDDGNEIWGNNNNNNIKKNKKKNETIVSVIICRWHPWQCLPQEG